MKNIILFVILSLISFTVAANEMYRAPIPGDSGTYFIIKSEKDDDGIISVLSSRVGKGNAYTDFTKLKVNCVSKQYFELGGSSEEGKVENPTKPLKDWPNSKWTSLVQGSSKSELVQYVCSKNK